LTASAFIIAATWSYGLAAALYALFAARMVLGWQRSARATLLAGAVLATTAWAVGGLYAGRLSTALPLVAMNVADALRYGLWFAFLGSLLRGDDPVEPERASRRRITTAVVALALVAMAAMSNGLPFAALLGDSGPQAELALHLGAAIFGLVLLEQLMRGAATPVRWALRPLALGLAGVFGYDLFMYADAMLFRQPDVDFWLARGAANALVIPFLAVATARNTGWTVEMHISRGAVFHSTALVVSGAFLMMIAAAGYLVRYLGGDWGRALQVELLFAAVLAMALVATSGRFRSRLKVFVSKHFFSYRYDYREEWLRFTRTLSSEAANERLPERVITALADLVESPAGALWLRDDARGFVPAARLNVPRRAEVEPLDGALPRFLAERGWIVSIPEAVATPTRYDSLALPAWLAGLPGAWLVVPLLTGADLIGFVVLTTPRAAIEIDWEVRDLLKTASRQAASYLAQVRATEALLEARKFDAFNRMSAFVVHDLKNLVAQLSLMLRNAERHQDNPEFQRDMLGTVQHVVERMNRLMMQLRTGTTPVEKPRLVELAPLVRRVCAAKSQGGTMVALDAADGVATIGHEDRLEHVIAHLVQNALDATRGKGGVRVAVSRDGDSALVEVADDGVGMTEEFVRERLGKPFETTKTAGMGIGVYESAQYLASVGGRLAIDSTPDVGTRVSVLLPLAESHAAVAAHPEAA